MRCSLRLSVTFAHLFSEIQDPAALKEKGNSLFKAGDMEGAVCCYTKALKLSASKADSAVLYRNRSACHLKLEEYNKAECDASKGRIISGIFNEKEACQLLSRTYNFFFFFHKSQKTLDLFICIIHF